jgi:tRNA(Met) cytidine acetyltransferase
MANLMTSLSPQLLAEYFSVLAHNGHRGIVHIAGSEAFCVNMAQQCIDAMKWQKTEHLPHQGSATISQHLQTLLGTEIDALIINAWQGFNPNVLGAASGCVKTGGALLLLTPPVNAWAGYQDPDYQRMLSPTHVFSEVQGRFVQHVIDIINANEHVIYFTESDNDIVLPQIYKQNDIFSADYSEQQKAIDAVQQVATGHSKRPLVITSDRGRGKSSTLGIAAAQLLRARDIRIVVTAPCQQNVKTLFQQAEKTLNLPHSSNLVLKNNHSIMQFMSVDAVLQQEGDIDLLLVDEAAAIPAHILFQLLNCCKRLVFSTTVDGYEGNGRGFSVRFLPSLQQRMPQTRVLQLHAPIRYAKDDPLEYFSNAALLLKSPEVLMKTLGEITYAHLDRDKLVKQKMRLAQIFSLLINAHYKTTPDDLRILLDHPDVSIDILESQGNVLAVALSMQEGGFDSQHINTLVQDNRRYRGHLIPQTLALSGFASMLPLSTQRILRIAVVPELQNQGFGKQLLQDIQQHSTADFIGASFSAELSVLRFWQSLDMQAVRLGVHKEPSTGQYACVVLKPLRDEYTELYGSIRQAYTENISYQLLCQHNDISPSLAIALLNNVLYALSAYDVEQVRLYLQKRCSFESVQASLYRVSLAVATHLKAYSVEHQLVVQKLWLNQSWSQVVSAFSHTGRKSAEDAMRKAWQPLFEQMLII